MQLFIEDIKHCLVLHFSHNNNNNKETLINEFHKKDFSYLMVSWWNHLIIVTQLQLDICSLASSQELVGQNHLSLELSICNINFHYYSNGKFCSNIQKGNLRENAEINRINYQFNCKTFFFFFYLVLEL